MKLKKTKKYDDIINLEHHVSKKHPHMDIRNRAAQFAPFAALTGHEEAIDDTAKSHLDELERLEQGVKLDGVDYYDGDFDD